MCKLVADMEMRSLTNREILTATVRIIAEFAFFFHGDSLKLHKIKYGMEVVPSSGILRQPSI